jgi:CubicO group peptidase (beta-lactamase class C family)
MKLLSSVLLFTSLSSNLFAVPTMSLYDEAADEIVKGYENITQGSLIGLKGLENKVLNLVVDPQDPAVKSVRFTWNNGAARTENDLPYTVHREDGTATAHFTVGIHRMSATMYSEPKAKGKVLGRLDIQLEIVESTEPDHTAPRILSLNIQNGSSLVLESDEKTKLSVDYGEDADSLDQKLESTGFSAQHSLLLRGLKPKTRYHYLAKVSDRAGNSSEAPLGSFVSPEAPTYTFPGANWERATPEEVGLRTSSINNGINSLKSKGAADKVVIIRYGKMVYASNNSKSKSPVWSCTKSFTSTVLGVLVQNGRAKLSDPAANYVSSIKSRYGGVTLRHLATMTSGYDANGGSYGNSNMDGSKTPLTAATPLFAPGTYSAYWDDAMNLFGVALGQAGGATISSIFKTHISDKIGIKSITWPNGASYGGKTHNTGAGSGRGIQISAEDMARFCYLMLRMGNWNGTQVLSRDWVEQATRVVQVPSSLKKHPKSGNNVSGHYGYNWWLNGAANSRRWPSLPPQMFAAFGAMGNFCIVVPEYDLVAVRLGTKTAGDGPNFVSQILEGAQQ